MEITRRSKLKVQEIFCVFCGRTIEANAPIRPHAVKYAGKTIPNIYTSRHYSTYYRTQHGKRQRRIRFGACQPCIVVPLNSFVILLLLLALSFPGCAECVKACSLFSASSCCYIESATRNIILVLVGVVYAVEQLVWPLAPTAHRFALWMKRANLPTSMRCIQLVLMYYTAYVFCWYENLVEQTETTRSVLVCAPVLARAFERCVCELCVNTCRASMYILYAVYMGATPPHKHTYTNKHTRTRIEIGAQKRICPCPVCPACSCRMCLGMLCMHIFVWFYLFCLHSVPGNASRSPRCSTDFFSMPAAECKYDLHSRAKQATPLMVFPND